MPYRPPASCVTTPAASRNSAGRRFASVAPTWLTLRLRCSASSRCGGTTTGWAVKTMEDYALRFTPQRFRKVVRMARGEHCSVPPRCDPGGRGRHAAGEIQASPMPSILATRVDHLHGGLPVRCQVRRGHGPAHARGWVLTSARLTSLICASFHLHLLLEAAVMAYALGAGAGHRAALGY
jgi:hypothetical protein